MLYRDDDTPEKHGKVPRWTQKHLLELALQAQEQIDPDEIFGTDWPSTCDLVEIFQIPKDDYKQKKFQRRTSSARWTPEKMTLERDMREYKKAMGWLRSPSQSQPK